MLSWNDYQGNYFFCIIVFVIREFLIEFRKKDFILDEQTINNLRNRIECRMKYSIQLKLKQR